MQQHTADFRKDAPKPLLFEKYAATKEAFLVSLVKMTLAKGLLQQI